MVFTRTKIKTMCQNLNRTIKTGLFLIAWLPTLLFGQDLVMMDFLIASDRLPISGRCDVWAQE